MTKGVTVIRGLTFLAALAGMLASPAVAGKLDPRDMLAASSPAKDSVVAEGIDTIVLTFAEPAEVVSVTVRLPDDTEVSALPEATPQRPKQNQFRYRLPGPLVLGGDYTISYLLTSQSFKSLNGFIDFRIEGDATLSLPETSTAPPPQQSD